MRSFPLLFFTTEQEGDVFGRGCVRKGMCSLTRACALAPFAALLVVLHIAESQHEADGLDGFAQSLLSCKEGTEGERLACISSQVVRTKRCPATQTVHLFVRRLGRSSLLSSREFPRAKLAGSGSNPYVTVDKLLQAVMRSIGIGWQVPDCRACEKGGRK